MKRGQAVCCSCFNICAFGYLCLYVFGCGGLHKGRATQPHTVARACQTRKQDGQSSQGISKNRGSQFAGVSRSLASLVGGVWPVQCRAVNLLRQKPAPPAPHGTARALTLG